MHTKHCSGGAILAINTNTYTNIVPYQTPPYLQHHIAMAILAPEAGSKPHAISIYMPQHNTNQGNKTYIKALQLLTKTLTEDLPHAAVILGGGSPSYTFGRPPLT